MLAHFWRCFAFGMGAAIITVAGCILCDQITTITIQPDGSADYLKVQTNVHSSESGSKGEAELSRYVEQVNARQDSDQLALVRAGAVLEPVHWIRRQPPMANVISARLPNAAALEKLFTVQDDGGNTILSARYSRDGLRRRLTLLVELPREDANQAAAPRTVAELRGGQAEGISETRFAVARGTIVAAKGFTIARDRQSALLEPAAILEVLRTQPQVEAWLEWEVQSQ